MNNNNILLHQEDGIALDDDFNFSDPAFDLQEPDIPSLSNSFSTASQTINFKLNKFDNLVKIAHINARSVPKHIHEIDKIVSETSLDILGISETFISDNTPKSIYQIPGFNFFNKNRDKKCRGV